MRSISCGRRAVGDRRRRGRCDRRTHRRQPVLHRRDHGHAAATATAAPRSARGVPTDGAGGRGRPSRRAPCRLRDLARRASVFLYSFDLRRARASSGRGPPTSSERPRGCRDPGARVGGRPALAGGSATRPCAMWRTRACRSASGSGSTSRSPTLCSPRAPASFAADHLELAALASLDLNPRDRTLAERAADAARRGRPRTPPHGEPLGRRSLRAGTGAGRAGGRLGRARGAGPGGLRRGPLLAGRVRRGSPRPGTARSSSGRRTRITFTLALALRFLGDIAINVEADWMKAEALLDRSLGRGRGARRAVGDQTYTPVRRLGAVDARPLRRGGGDLAAGARRRGARRPVGAGPRAHERSRSTAGETSTPASS